MFHLHKSGAMKRSESLIKGSESWQLKEAKVGKSKSSWDIPVIFRINISKSKNTMYLLSSSNQENLHTDNTLDGN